MNKYFLATSVRKLRLLTGLIIGFLLFGLLLALPITALAAWNTVRFTADTDIRIPTTPAITLVASSGSNVGSLVVNPTNIVITGAFVDVNNRSSITLTSAQRYVLSNNWGVRTICGPHSSSLTITWASAESIIIIPDGTVCPPPSAEVRTGVVSFIAPPPIPPVAQIAPIIPPVAQIAPTIPAMPTLPYPVPTTTAEIQANLVVLQTRLLSLLQQLLILLQAQLQALL